ncbi:hypothetical protein C4J96_2998 [Pseudomonas orientalis]|nr:hypothetical protein C4J96_2998 [Pseudomonas orientalis]
MPVSWLNRAVHNSQVALENASALHAFAGNGDQVNVRRADI